MFLLLLVWDLFQVYHFSPDVLCYLLDLELPEMSELDLDLASRYRNNPEHRLFCALPDF